MKKQKGFSLLNVMLMLIYGSMTVILGLQIGVGYLNKSTISETVDLVLTSAKGNSSIKDRDIKRNIVKQLGLDSIEIDEEEIYIKRSNNNISVEVDYIKKIKLTEDIKIVMDLTVKK